MSFFSSLSLSLVFFFLFFLPFSSSSSRLCACVSLRSLSLSLGALPFLCSVCSPYLALTAACVFRSPRVPPPAGLLCLDASLLERYRHPQSRGGCVCEEPVYYTYTQCTPYDAQVLFCFFLYSFSSSSSSNVCFDGTMDNEYQRKF